jgi:hypothetical protein
MDHIRPYHNAEGIAKFTCLECCNEYSYYRTSWSIIQDTKGRVGFFCRHCHNF